MPPALLRLVVKTCSDLDCPPFWWMSDRYRRKPVPDDWRVAMAIIVGVCSMKGYTREELNMSGETWKKSKTVWGALSELEKQIFTGIQGEGISSFRRSYLGGSEC